VNRLAPVFVLLAVTALLLGYGSYSWSWLAGPIAATATWCFGRQAEEPAAPAPARTGLEPAPVD
jgi:hypothetical protein